MNFVIDIGNSFIKLSVFKENKILHLLKFEKSNTDELINKINYLKNKFPEKINSVLSSVSDINLDLEFFLTEISELYINLNDRPDIPIKNLYKTPETLGTDRIAAVVGANNIFPNRNILIFDIGTAMTIDFVNSDNIYEGGNISPGILMRFKALNTFTKKLPLIKPCKYSEILIGKSTKEAILAGVQNGIFFEINGYIDSYRRKYNNLKIIFTGGDNFFFEKKIKINTFADPNLVLKGLNRILEYNAKKN